MEKIKLMTPRQPTASYGNNKPAVDDTFDKCTTVGRKLMRHTTTPKDQLSTVY